MLSRAGAQVLAGVELGGLLGEDLANGSGHGQTRVGVDVDLANGAGGSLAELLFGDTYGVGELTAILVDDVDFFLGYAGGTVEDDGETGELLHNGVEHVEGQGRRNEVAGLRVTGALIGSELVGTVARTDGDGQAVAARAGSEVYHLFGLRVVALSVADFVFHTGENAELTLSPSRSN